MKFIREGSFIIVKKQSKLRKHVTTLYIVSKFIKKSNLSTNNTYMVHKVKVVCKNLYRNVNGEKKL